MSFTLRYKPMSDGRQFAQVTLRDLEPDAEYKRLNILAHLSAIHTEEEMAEFEIIPSGWLISMYPEVWRWGINGENIESFFEKISDIARTNPEEIRKKYSDSAHFLRDNTRVLNRAIQHAYNSVNEKYPLRHMRGIRLEWIKSNIRTYDIKDVIEFTPLSDITSTDYKNVFILVVLAISCQDRVGKFGSGFSQKDYDLLTNVWQDYITLPK